MENLATNSNPKVQPELFTACKKDLNCIQDDSVISHDKPYMGLTENT